MSTSDAAVDYLPQCPVTGNILPKVQFNKGTSTAANWGRLMAYCQACCIYHNLTEALDFIQLPPAMQRRVLADLGNTPPSSHHGHVTATAPAPASQVATQATSQDLSIRPRTIGSRTLKAGQTWCISPKCASNDIDPRIASQSCASRWCSTCCKDAELASLALPCKLKGHNELTAKAQPAFHALPPPPKDGPASVAAVLSQPNDTPTATAARRDWSRALDPNWALPLKERDELKTAKAQEAALARQLREESRKETILVFYAKVRMNDVISSHY